MLTIEMADALRIESRKAQAARSCEPRDGVKIKSSSEPPGNETPKFTRPAVAADNGDEVGDHDGVDEVEGVVDVDAVLESVGDVEGDCEGVVEIEVVLEGDGVIEGVCEGIFAGDGAAGNCKGAML